MDIMLVWRIARPVTTRRIDFNHNEPVTGKTGWEDIVDLPGSIIPTTDLDLDVRWRNQAWFMVLISGCLRHSYLAVSLSSHRE
jgi:hypothetical protein